jgi:hypothetical protein
MKKKEPEGYWLQYNPTHKMSEEALALFWAAVKKTRNKSAHADTVYWCSEKAVQELFPNFVPAKKVDFFAVLQNRLSRSHRLGRRPHIVNPPGSLMQFVAEFFCSRKSYEQVAKPIIADMQHEYFEALVHGRLLKARWIHLRDCCALFLSLGIFKLVQVVWNMWRRVRVL